MALSALYQGRVMTSAVSEHGRSLGWIHRAFIESKRTGTAFDNYGGEDRFWLGPEGGQLGLYFPKGAPFTFEAWQTPHPLQEGAWDVVERGPSHVVFARAMTVSNRAGTTFTLQVRRRVALLSRDDAEKTLRLSAPVPSELGFVGFEYV